MFFLPVRAIMRVVYHIRRGNARGPLQNRRYAHEINIVRDLAAAMKGMVLRAATKEPPLTPPWKGGGQEAARPFQKRRLDCNPWVLRVAGGQQSLGEVLLFEAEAGLGRMVRAKG